MLYEINATLNRKDTASKLALDEASVLQLGDNLLVAEIKGDDPLSASAVAEKLGLPAGNVYELADDWESAFTMIRLGSLAQVKDLTERTEYVTERYVEDPSDFRDDVDDDYEPDFDEEFDRIEKIIRAIPLADKRFILCEAQQQALEGNGSCYSDDDDEEETAWSMIDTVDDMLLDYLQEHNLL